MKETKVIHITPEGKEFELTFKKGKYSDKTLAIRIYCRDITKNKDNPVVEPFCMLTVNLGSRMFEGTQFVDSNNCPMEVIESLEDMNVITRCGIGYSGFCSYYCYQFDADWLKSLPSM